MQWLSKECQHPILTQLLLKKAMASGKQWTDKEVYHRLKHYGVLQIRNQNSLNIFLLVTFCCRSQLLPSIFHQYSPSLNTISLTLFSKSHDDNWVGLWRYYYEIQVTTVTVKRYDAFNMNGSGRIQRTAYDALILKFSEISFVFVLRFFRRHFSDYFSELSAQAQALPTHPAVQRWPLLLPSPVPPQCQGVPDRHGHVPEDGEEAGQLL